MSVIFKLIKSRDDKKDVENKERKKENGESSFPIIFVHSGPKEVISLRHSNDNNKVKRESSLVPRKWANYACSSSRQ